MNSYFEYWNINEPVFRKLAVSEQLCEFDSWKELASKLVDQFLLGASVQLLSGPCGSGKTHFIKFLVQQMPAEKYLCFPISVVAKPTSSDWLISKISRVFGCSSNLRNRGISLADIMEDAAQKDQRILIIIDNADALEASAAEQVRGILNLQQLVGDVVKFLIVGSESVKKHFADLIGTRLSCVHDMPSLVQVDIEKYFYKRAMNLKKQIEVDPNLFGVAFKQRYMSINDLNDFFENAFIAAAKKRSNQLAAVPTVDRDSKGSASPVRQPPSVEAIPSEDISFDQIIMTD